MDENDSKFPRTLIVRPEYKFKFIFPDDKLNQDDCRKSVEFFARQRLSLVFSEFKHDEITFRYNTFLPDFVKEYPLPIGHVAITRTYLKHRWDEDSEIIIPSPFVERHEAYLGLAQYYESESTIGWFLGLVEVYDIFDLPSDEKEKLTFDEKYWLFYSRQFRFVEGMFLLEGKFDKRVTRQLKKFEMVYNEKILGKLTVGHPLYDPEDYLGPARSIIQRYPDITQRELVKRIGCDERTFRRWREIAKFDTFRQFKNSVLKK